MYSIEVAPDTSQPDRSRDSSDVQPQNMPDRSAAAEETPQPDRSRDLSDEQPRNVPARAET